MDRATFVDHVQDVLVNLHDRAYLANHPLAGHLTERQVAITGDQLNRLLIDTIDRLRPAASSPATSPSYRRYRYLELRYLDGQSHKTIAHELGLSLRQAHRVRAEALNAVASALWPQVREASRPTGPTQHVERLAVVLAPSADPRAIHASLDDEVARLGREEVDAPADLLQETRATIDVIEPLIRQRAVRIELEVPTGTQTVAVGRALLRQIVLLLVSYALERQADRRIYLAVSPVESDVTLDVVFAPQVVGAEGPASSQDPRLITARRLVETQDGSLEVFEQERHAYLRLALPPGKIHSVLSIDDNPDLGQLFDAYLKGTRYRLLRAKTAQGALRLAANAQPDIITLDVMMPFHDGWEVFRQLRENLATQTIPVIVCSILPEKDLALALGAVDFLAKPVTRQNLIATLDRCLPS